MTRFYLFGFLVCGFGIAFGFPSLGFAEINSNTQATEFAIFAGGDVNLESYSTVLGDTYAGHNANISFALGIQRPDRHLGNYYAVQDIVTTGGLSDFNGNLSANRNIFFDSNGVDVNGNAIYGNEISSNASSIVNGSIQKVPNSVPILSLPDATTFSAGSNDYNELPGQDTVTLTPGSYRNVSLTSKTDQLHLSSGDYYMRRLDTWISTELHLDTTGGPINVYVANDVFFESGLNVFINGEEISSSLAIVPQNVDEAHKVTFEVHGDFTIDPGFLSNFFGTVFVPFGNVEVDANNFFGSIISGQDVTGNVYIEHYASHRLMTVPEPGFAIISFAAPVCLLSRRGRRFDSNG